jgi:hypothetical protein
VACGCALCIRGRIAVRWPCLQTFLSVPCPPTVPWVYKACPSSLCVYTITFHHTFSISDLLHSRRMSQLVMSTAWLIPMSPPAYTSIVFTPIIISAGPYIIQATPPSPPPPPPPTLRLCVHLMAEVRILFLRNCGVP